jgi:hypothetical protein
MTLSDPLEWVIIGVFALGVLGFVVYFLFRVFQTLARADKYLGSKDENLRQST